MTPKLISCPGPADDSFSPLCCTCRSGTDGTNYVPSCSLVLLVKKLQHFNELAFRVGVLPLKSECKVIAFFNTSKIFQQKSAKKSAFFLDFCCFSAFNVQKMQILRFSKPFSPVAEISPYAPKSHRDFILYII